MLNINYGDRNAEEKPVHEIFGMIESYKMGPYTLMMNSRIPKDTIL